MKPLKKMKGLKYDKIALVLGNGPSLRKLNVEDIEKYSPDIFVVNDFYLKPIARLIQPQYYCLSDPDSLIQPSIEMRHSASATLDYIETNNCTLILSHFYRKLQIPTSIKKIFFNDREFTIFSKNINPCKPRGYSSLTVLKALSVAIYFGYKKIYILGIDNTEFKAIFGSKNNELWMRTDKLYEDKNLEAFTYPVYSSGGISGKFLQYAIWFGDFLKFSNGKIINLDTESLIDAFPKSESIIEY